MANICLCLTGKTLAQNLEIIEKYRKYIDMAELRVDCLESDERLLIRRFPEQAGLPVILTIRRKIDGGFYDSGEAGRITLISKGLAFAEIDKRHNFAYVDLEEDLEVPGLEEAVRTFGTRIIRSSHNLEGVGDITRKIRSLYKMGDEIAKVAVTPHNISDVLAIYRSAKETSSKKKILVGMGPYGANTRILAEYLGSFLTYTSALEEQDLTPAAPGQMSPRQMAEQYRFKEISAATEIYGIVGFPLKATFSPHIFNTVFTHEKINAIYVPFPADNLSNFLELAAELGIKGASVTIPYKEAILPYLHTRSDSVEAAGACNTIKAVPQKTEDSPRKKNPKCFWHGINTDTLGFSESLLHFTGRKNFRSCMITILGAGGAARAVAAEIHRLKGKCLILNRNPVRARELAQSYGYKWGSMDRQSLDIMEKYSNIIIQATPVGTFPNVDDDPFELYHFNGYETVVDLIYNPPMTAFLKRAQAAGCSVLNGFDMLIRQAKYQYQCFFGRDFPEQLIPRLKKTLQS
ncbi:MAG: type I 3-dehydroquinate dehydratase [Spirochaetaceae bacterium]|jgi:3-dehydroquinate dehydratase/shikimate dehydrogenase|nr:type I 3-dehydroquinate dehydratase [Spirochaetaceae bacterium]